MSQYVVGPIAATGNTLCAFDSDTGKLIRDTSMIATNEGGIIMGGTLIAANVGGHNTGDVTLGPFGTIPDPSGASISGQVLTMQPASAICPGSVSTAAQSMAGIKSFTNGLALANVPSFPGSNVMSTYDYASDPSISMDLLGPWSFIVGSLCTYEKFQHTVNVFIAPLPGTMPGAANGSASLISNAAFPGSYIPSAFRPSADQQVLAVMVNAGVGTWCHVLVASTGVITFSNGPQGTLFPAGGNVCGHPPGGIYFSYPV